MQPKYARRIRVACTQMLEFADFDSLADCAVMLVKRNIPCPQSRLYRIGNRFRLLIRSEIGRGWLCCGEFCTRQSRQPWEVAYTEEHGVLLLGNHAVRRIGNAFMKDFSKT